MSQQYQMCRTCVMDTTDPHISFDSDGVCSHCHYYAKTMGQMPSSPEERQTALSDLIADIRSTAGSSHYDCVVGISGGVDSTFVAWTVKQLGLNPLAVHLDNGWNTELSVKNIENIVRKLELDLHTVILDWDEFRDLQVSFLKASTTDAEVPTDHAIFASLYQAADNNNIPWIIDGSNMWTEGFNVTGWTYGIYDWEYIKRVHRIFSSVPLRTFPHFSRQDQLYYEKVKGITNIHILNYVEYDKNEAGNVLQNELNWRPYGGKHYESVYTRFFQGYILPRKFNIDKRKAHLSALIYSGQITRDQALKELDKDPYDGYDAKDDRQYVIKKLGLSDTEFDKIMALPPKTKDDYPRYIEDVRTDDSRSIAFLNEFARQRLLYLASQHKRIAMFPAGKHTGWLLDLVKDRLPPETFIVFDDRYTTPTTFASSPAYPADLVGDHSFDVTLLSSDCPSEKLKTRAHKLFHDCLVDFYPPGFPEGPFCKAENPEL